LLGQQAHPQTPRASETGSRDAISQDDDDGQHFGASNTMAVSATKL